MRDLHHDIQRVDKYIQLIHSFGALTRREAAARILADYLLKKTEIVRTICREQAARPRVYYAMGKPQFCIKGKRFENHLVELCNGVSVNREIELHGRPGVTIDVETLEMLNPEIIFISSFISNSPDDFYKECLEKNIRVDAVRDKRIHTAPIPSSDFGGPKWILGLMHIANKMYGEACAFDIAGEATEFYARFLGTPFDVQNVNRSFGKPDASWRWETAGGRTPSTRSPIGRPRLNAFAPDTPCTSAPARRWTRK